MAKKDRSKEIWHIPKRCSVHQTIGITEILSLPEFYKKAWNHGRQEAIGTKLGQKGLTASGKPITGQAIRTLLALPKYLGFVYVDKSSIPPKIITTDIGFDLIKAHSFGDGNFKNLDDYKKHNQLIETSPIFQFQMIKLQITNPVISSDCENIFVFPFRATLKLLTELEYLDIEELAYIVFSIKTQDEVAPVIERIKNFRSLPIEKRNAEINAFKKTNEGQLTLVKAPSAGYYISLCVSTGLCKKCSKKINSKELSCLELIDKEEVRKILNKFDSINTFDFGDNLDLWISYFANPKRLFPPQNVRISFKNCDNSYLVTINEDQKYIFGDVVEGEKNYIDTPLFPDEEYSVDVYDLNKGHKFYSTKLKVGLNHKKGDVDLPCVQPIAKERSIENITESISEMFGKDKFDIEYSKKVEIIRKVLGLEFNDNRRRGDRLEYLFFELLSKLKDKGIIDEVFWYGKVAKYGICEPAPGGKAGNPDLTFSINDFIIVLELTTIPGVRAQWNSAEASSVPDHIFKFQTENPRNKIIGVFSAPTIHHQLKKNLERHSYEDKMSILTMPIEELCGLLQNSKREDLIDFFDKVISK